MRKLRASSLATAALVLLATLLSGCVGLRPDPILRTGPGVDFDSTQVKSFRDNQDKVLAELYLSAGLSAQSTPANAGDWGKVINAGMDYAEQRCEAYMHALFRLNRDRNTAVSQIGLLGAATAGILAAVEATAKEVAITAILFGLAGATVDNYSSNLLYELEPSSVRTLVRGLQAGYKAVLPTPLGYDTRPGAVAVIRGFAALCVPANIEAEVNLAVKKSTPVATPGDASKGQPPAVSNNLPVVTLNQISDAKKINRAVARLIKDTTKRDAINKVLKDIGAAKSDFTTFPDAANALDDEFRDMTPSDTEKWLKALGI